MYPWLPQTGRPLKEIMDAFTLAQIMFIFKFFIFWTIYRKLDFKGQSNGHHSMKIEGGNLTFCVEEVIRGENHKIKYNIAVARCGHYFLVESQKKSLQNDKTNNFKKCSYST